MRLHANARVSVGERFNRRFEHAHPGWLISALDGGDTINDHGEIAGVGVDANGNQHAFLLIPCGHDDDACQNAAEYPESRPIPKITKPASNPTALRRMFRQRSGPVLDIFSPGTSSVRTAGATINSPDERIRKLPIRTPFVEIEEANLYGVPAAISLGTFSNTAAVEMLWNACFEWSPTWKQR
jgi:hypothetical protein